jgi:AhpD family alkylhydroperoxidase
MPLESRDKELAAIGASIGANCRPCIEHHLAAGGAAGLSPDELAAAVEVAEDVRRQAVELLSARVAELLGGDGPQPDPIPIAETSKARELVALGSSVGANSHRLVQAHVRAAVTAGLELHQVKSALKMAGYVQQRAAEITAEEAARAVAECADELTASAAT